MLIAPPTETNLPLWRLHDRIGVLALRIPSQNPAYHHWTSEEDVLLGTMPDEVLAKRLGVSLIAVVARRQRKHVPSIDARPDWSPAEDKLLGTAPDDEIARRLDRTAVAVSLRRKLGIPPEKPALSSLDGSE